MIWLELLGYWLLFALALDALVWLVVLTVAGLCRGIARFAAYLNPYRGNPTL